MKRILFLFVGLLFLFSCEYQDNGVTSIDDVITSDYLLNDDLDVYLQKDQVIRLKGKPGIETITIGDKNLLDFEDCFVMYVESGIDAATAVSSAIIKLDGMEVLNTSDFSKNHLLKTFEVCNLTETSVLTVEVRGEPGSYIEIWIEGKKKELTVKDCDGNIYKTVKIGNQVWMAENLKTTKYCSGEVIPQIKSGDVLTFTNKAYCWYNDDISNKDIYGALYSWAAAMNGIPDNNNPSKVQGACPTGWHIPSYYEWAQLETDLGGSDIAGGKMKEIGTVHWARPNTGATNESGFSGLPGGYVGNDYSGNLVYSHIGHYGFWWHSTSEYPSRQLAYRTYLFYDQTISSCGDYHGTNVAFSVRCVKD